MHLVIIKPWFVCREVEKISYYWIPLGARRKRQAVWVGSTIAEVSPQPQSSDKTTDQECSTLREDIHKALSSEIASFYIYIPILRLRS
jgi:hypothetical protein